MVLGVAGLYLTDSLYDPPQDKLPTPSRRAHMSNLDASRAGNGAFPQPRGTQATSNFYDVDDDVDDGELVPLTAGTPECVTASLGCFVAFHVSLTRAWACPCFQGCGRG